MKHFLNERQVEIVESDWDTGEGAWVTSAYYIDTDVDLTDDELDLLTDLYQDEIYQDKYETAVDAAHDYFEER